MPNQVEIINLGALEGYEITSDVEAADRTRLHFIQHEGLNLLCIAQDRDEVRLTKAEVEALITVLTELKEQM